jgi:hypothetical protein
MQHSTASGFGVELESQMKKVDFSRGHPEPEVLVAKLKLNRKLAWDHRTTFSTPQHP